MDGHVGPPGSQHADMAFKSPSNRSLDTAETLKPLEAGEAAALGLRLKKRVDWLRVDTTGIAAIVEVCFYTFPDSRQAAWTVSAELS